MAELEAIVDALGRAGSYAMLRFAVDTADPGQRRAAGARAGARHRRSRRSCSSSSSSGPRSTTTRADELLERRRAWRPTRHHLRTLRRYRPHLLSEPEEKLLTEKALTGRDAWTRLFSELTSAIRVELPDADEGVPLDVALSRLVSPDRELRRTHGRGGHRRARAGPAHARLRLQHAAARQGRRRPPALATRTGWPAATSPTRPATSRSRRCSRPCAPTTTCRSAGTASRPSCSASTGWPTTTAWPRWPTRRRRSSWPEATRPRPHVLPRVLARARRPRPALLRRALDRRSRAPEQARRRLLRLHDAQRAPLRDAQLHEPPARRARARPRARPRPARGARDPARAASSSTRR